MDYSFITEFLSKLWLMLVEHLQKVLPSGVFDIIAQVPMPLEDEEA